MTKQEAQDKANSLLVSIASAARMDRIHNEGGYGFETEDKKIAELAEFAKQIQSFGLYLMGNDVIDADDLVVIRGRWNAAVGLNAKRHNGNVNQAEVERATGYRLSDIVDAKLALGVV